MLDTIVVTVLQVLLIESATSDESFVPPLTLHLQSLSSSTATPLIPSIEES